MTRYKMHTMRAIIKFFFASIGWDASYQEDGSVLVKDNHGDLWHVRCKAIDQ